MPLDVVGAVIGRLIEPGEELLGPGVVLEHDAFAPHALQQGGRPAREIVLGTHAQQRDAVILQHAVQLREPGILVLLVEMGEHRDGVDRVERRVVVAQRRQRLVVVGGHGEMPPRPFDRLAVDVGTVQHRPWLVSCPPVQGAAGPASEIEDPAAGADRLPRQGEAVEDGLVILTPDRKERLQVGRPVYP